MRPTPFPHQIAGAEFLAERRRALLADEPRVGKTGASIMAADLVLARNVLVVTTATGRANMAREWREWQTVKRSIQVVYGSKVDKLDGDVVIVAWSIVADKKLQELMLARTWDVVILDESHYAKNPTAKRTKAVYGKLIEGAGYVWCLSGTPMPNAPNDLWPMLRALAPERIAGMTYEAFERQYCITKTKFVSGHRIEVVVGGKNLHALRQRLEGFWLRRTQQDVGIREPIYSVFPLHANDFNLSYVEQQSGQVQQMAAEILVAAETGDTKFLEMHLGPLRRVTGLLKAKAIAKTVVEELEAGTYDKVVLMCWHTGVIDELLLLLRSVGCVCLDGRSNPSDRQKSIEAFQSGEARVFVGQIQAAGEAIDLSAASELIFVEASFTPKDLKQAALRITNHNQKRQCLVRFAALAGSIDEAVMAIITRKVATIREVFGGEHARAS